MVRILRLGTRYRPFIEGPIIEEEEEGGGGGVEPPVIVDETDPIVWYDFSDTDTITEASDLVSKVDDISGNENHAYQASGSLKVETGFTINSLNAVNIAGEKRMALAAPVDAIQFFAAVEMTATGQTSVVLGAESDGSPEARFTVAFAATNENTGTVSHTADGHEENGSNVWSDEYVAQNVVLIGLTPYIPTDYFTATVKIGPISAEPGQTVTQADLTWACDWTQGAYKGFQFRIYGVADPDAADVGSGNLPLDQTLTTANVLVDTSIWAGYDEFSYWQPSAEVIDISEIVQELINHANWTQNDDFQLIITPVAYPSGDAGISFNSTESGSTLLSLAFAAEDDATPSSVNFDGNDTGIGYYAVDGENYEPSPVQDSASDIGTITGPRILSGYFAEGLFSGADGESISLETFFGRAGLTIPEEAKISELMWYNRVVSFAEKYAIESYLADKYGVTLIDGAGSGGGGTGTGGGGATAAVITRKFHSQEVFVTQGNTLTVTYVSDVPCFFQPVCGSQFEPSISEDGLEITLTWDVPADLAGTSDYVGVIAWRYGSDSTEVYTELFDIYHVGKDAGDIKTLGAGTAYERLQTGIEQPADSGDTLIIENGYYDHSLDTLMIGYYEDGQLNSSTPNGVSSGSTSYDVIGSDGVSVIGSENIVDITKYTTIIARTPLDVIIDRQYRYNSSRMIGNYRDGSTDGLRTTHGIEIKGISFRRTQNGPSSLRADRCHYKWCSVVQDILPSDFNALYPGDPEYYADGGSFFNQSSRFCSFEGISAIGNSRFGYIASTGYAEDERAVKYCSVKQCIVTNACSHGYNDEITQAFTFYGARHMEVLNCISIDSEIFKYGVTEAINISTPMDPNFSFICTNQTADDVHFERIAAINDIRGGIHVNPSLTSITNTVKNSFFWGKDGYYTENSMTRCYRTNMTNITVGNNGALYAGGGSAIDDDTAEAIHLKFLIIYPRWDLTYTDKICGGTSTASSDDEMVFIPSTQLPTGGYLDNINNYYAIDGDDWITAGAQYLARPEYGSTIEGYDVGCRDWFAMMGDTHYPYQDNSPTLHDGSGGAQYINWLSRLPIERFKRERATFSSTVGSTEYTGDVGAFAANVNIVDYINRKSTSPDKLYNTPFIDDFYVYINEDDLPVIVWRPVCPEYREYITGFDLYVDGVLQAADVDKSFFYYAFDGIASGSRTFRIVVKDSVWGNSGFSRPFPITVP